MWSFITSAFSWLLGWIFRLSTIKFIVFGALALVLAPLMTLLLGLIDATGLDQIPSLVGQLPEGLLFYLGVFRLDVGLPMLVAAALVRFFIRRLPIVG